LIKTFCDFPDTFFGKNIYKITTLAPGSGDSVMTLRNEVTGFANKKQVSATTPSILCGFLSLRVCQLSPTGALTGGGGTPVKRWFALHSDFVLYTFKTEADCHALTATPMPGYTILTGPELKGEPGIGDRERTIKMFYAPQMTSQQSSVSAACRKAYLFTGSSPAEVKRSA
jgi:hypothetical protein